MSKKYHVTIRATITKIYEIEADDEDSAADQAHEKFIVLPEDDIQEDYEQETVFVEAVDFT